MPASSELPRYFLCHAGDGSDPDSPVGLLGRVYRWDGEWIRSPEDVADRDRNPIMKLIPVYGNDFIIEGDIGCYTEVYFDTPPF